MWLFLAKIFKNCIRAIIKSVAGHADFYDFACYTNITEKYKKCTGRYGNWIYQKVICDVNSLSHYDTFETLILCILKSCKLSCLNLHSLILLGL